MRTRIFLMSVLSVLSASAASSAQPADPVHITEGTLIGTREGGEIDIRGDRGFSLIGGGATASGVFEPGNCAELCEPGPLSIRAAWSGSDLGGTVTIDGNTYGIDIGTEETGSAVVEFDGEIRLPALGNSDEPFTVSTPFSFTGSFAYPITPDQPPAETLVGRGIATLTFTRNHELGTWIFQNAVYEFRR